MFGGRSMIFQALKVCWKKKLKKERDQTQFLQHFLTSMTQKGLGYILYQSK
jgi:hypothetical protein